MFWNAEQGNKGTGGHWEMVSPRCEILAAGYSINDLLLVAGEAKHMHSDEGLCMAPLQWQGADIETLLARQHQTTAAAQYTTGKKARWLRDSQTGRKAISVAVSTLFSGGVLD